MTEILLVDMSVKACTVLEASYAVPCGHASSPLIEAIGTGHWHQATSHTATVVTWR